MAKHPIKEIGDQLSKERLMQSIERGNLHQVTFVRGDRDDKMFIEANPQFKTLNIYDATMKKVFQEHEKKEAKPEQQKDSADGKKQEEKKKNNNDMSEESPDKGQRNFSRKRLGCKMNVGRLAGGTWIVLNFFLQAFSTSHKKVINPFPKAPVRSESHRRSDRIATRNRSVSTTSYQYRTYHF